MTRKIGLVAAATAALSLFAGPFAGAADSNPLKEAWKRLPTAEKHFRKGFEDIQEGRLDDAAAALRKCVEAIPQHAYARYYLANISYMRGDYREALSQMESCLKGLDFMGDLNDYAVEQKSQSISSYRQMLDSEWENAVNCRAQREVESLADEISTQEGKLEIQAAEERSARSLRDAQFRAFLGHIHFQLKQLPEALAAYEEALALNPRHASAANNVAAIHYMAGDLKGALDRLERAERAGVGDNLNLKLKHLVLEGLGRPTAGILEEDLTAGPDADLGVVRFALSFKGGGPLWPVLYENGYLVFSRKSGQAILIDPGVEDPRFAGLVDKNGLRVEAIFNTHGHPDHSAADGYYAKLFKAPVFIARPDATDLDVAADRLLEDGETVDFDGFSVRVLLTPGHTPGSACFLVGDRLFSGDTLMRHDLGKVSFEGANQTAEAQRRLARLVREKILVLGDGTLVCPGHGPTTTVAEEKAGNPFLNK